MLILKLISLITISSIFRESKSEHLRIPNIIHQTDQKEGKLSGDETVGATGSGEDEFVLHKLACYLKFTLLHPRKISVRITKVTVDNIATHEFMSKGREKFILEINNVSVWAFIARCLLKKLRTIFCMTLYTYRGGSSLALLV